MTLDATARNLAKRLTEKYGKTVTIRRVTQNTYDMTTGLGGEDQPPIDHTVKVTPPENFMFRCIDGTLIKEGDQVVSFPALDAPIVPDKKLDSIVMDGDTWELKQIGKLYSGELVAMYILHLTK